MDRWIYRHTDGWNFPPMFYRTSSPIGSAAQKHRDVDILFSKIVHAHTSMKDDYNKNNDDDFMITDHRKDDNAKKRMTDDRR